MTGIGGDDGRKDWDDDGLPEDQPYEPTPFDEVGEGSGARLPLGEDDRLPWLESPDDVDLDEDGVDAGRIVGFVVMGIISLALILGAVYWFSHRSTADEADGSLVEASKDPYKVKPEDAEGKVFEGTGDTSFKVSEGLRPQGQIGASEAAPQPTIAAPPAPGPVPAASASKAPAAQASAGPAPAASGVGVQIGAFSSRALAEAAWSRYQSQHEGLSGLSHRVVEGKADIGTVYRLQAVAGDPAAARSLCSALQAGGLKCQVK